MYPGIIPYPETHSKSKTRKLVVFLHGYGSDGHDLLVLAPFFKSYSGCMNDAHFMAPDGIEHCEVSIAGYQWFSMRNRSPSVIADLIKEGSSYVSRMIKEKQEQLGLENKDTTLIGFSQGAMLGVNMTLAAEQPFAATVAYSGKLIAPQEIVNKKTPICIVHGMEDDVVPVSEAKYMKEFCDKLGIVTEALFPDKLMHSINNDGIVFASKFLSKHIAAHVED